MRNRAAGADSSPAVGKTTKAPAVAFFDVDGTLYQSNALRIVWYSLFHGTWRDRLIGLMAAMLSPLFVFLYFFVFFVFFISILYSCVVISNCLFVSLRIISEMLAPAVSFFKMLTTPT